MLFLNLRSATSNGSLSRSLILGNRYTPLPLHLTNILKMSNIKDIVAYCLKNLFLIIKPTKKVF